MEKLLYTCPDVRRVYILVRQKRGVAASERLAALLDSPVFTGTGRTPRDLCQQKITPIYGDAAEERLGLTDEDWTKLTNEVNVIINSAASVRFDDPMVKALAINCLSAVSCLQLCKEATNCVSFVHISTCYANCQLLTTEEKIYPTKVTLENLMEMSKWMPADKLDELCKSDLFDGRPNSYVFTKALAEDYLSRHSQGLPVAITRLSMVLASRFEPEVGFVDVTQACIFVGFTQALGALRTFPYNPTSYPQCVPVDTAANSVLIIAYLSATKPTKSVRVYNATTKKISLKQSLALFSKVARDRPTIKAFRPPIDLSTPPSNLSYQYNRWITEWLFVVILQFIIRLFGLKQ